MSPPILAIVGYTNSGKTTLIEKLIAYFTTTGLRIASIKHSHHQPQLDRQGKDSWRHKQAGAVTSFLLGPTQMQMISNIKPELTPALLVQRFCSNDSIDLVLLEGYSSMAYAKIEVLCNTVSTSVSTSLRCPPEELLAIVTDHNKLHDLQRDNSNIPNIPIFASNDVQGLAIYILRWMNSRDKTQLHS